MQPSTLTDQQLINQLADAIRHAATTQPSWLSYVPAVSAAIAAFLSLVSIRVTNRLARQARGNKLLPIIVFYRRPERIWILKNVGEGTALKVSVRNYSDATHVQDEVELYPVVPGQEIKLDYLKGADRLVAHYVNIFGQDPHYTNCSRNTNETKSGELREQSTASFTTGHESDVEKWPMTRL